MVMLNANQVDRLVSYDDDNIINYLIFMIRMMLCSKILRTLSFYFIFIFLFSDLVLCLFIF